MRPISPTWRMMVSVHCWKTSGSVKISSQYLRLRRSAESWMGVSGFLISWAMRRATSAQAAVRWAPTRSVMSSKVTTKPCGRAALAGDLHAESARGAPPRLMADFAARPAHRLGHGARRISGAKLRHGFGIVAALPCSSGAALSRRAAARLTMVMWPSRSRPITPALTPDSTVSVNRRRSRSAGWPPRDRCAGRRAAGSCG